MSFCDSFSSSFAPFDPTGIGSMTFSPQFPNEQRLVNSVFDHESPPVKRRKISSDSHRTYQMHPAVNQPINGKMFFKTRLCKNFIMGQCKNGENCNFAHGEEDLRKPPPNWQELIGTRMEDKMNNREDDDDKMINRMKLCRKFFNGEECSYGPRCNFSHVKFRDNSTPFRYDGSGRECSSISIGPIRPPMAMVQARTHQSNTHYVPVSAMDIDPIPSKAYVGVASTQSVQPNNKGFLKWKLNKKINRIYGDWINDQPLILPNEEEN